jgi:flagellar biosynthesis component FlhA
MSLNKKLEDLQKDLEEANVTSGGEAFDTPLAFSKSKKEDEKNSGETAGWKKVKTESKFMTLAKAALLSEVSYKDYKNNTESTQKQKVNRAIREINSRLYKIEGVINQNIKLKTEAGIDSNKYWKSTRSNLHKISEKMQRISERLRRF